MEVESGEDLKRFRSTSIWNSGKQETNPGALVISRRKRREVPFLIS
jgi:hypothetical protein